MTKIVGFANCAKELKMLLDEVSVSISAAGRAGPDALSQAVRTEGRKLVEFTNRTEPKDVFDPAEVAAIRKIDESADDARRRLFGDSADVIIGRMSDRISEINQLEKAVRQEAAQNERTANRLRLVPVRNAVDAVTEVADAVVKAKDALNAEDDNEAALSSKMDSVLRAITALEKAAKEFV